MTARCELTVLLRAGGPVRVSLRICCLLALVGRQRPADPEQLRRGTFVCLAEDPGEVPAPAPAPAASGAST
jgi:hypothetical protein